MQTNNAKPDIQEEGTVPRSSIADRISAFMMLDSMPTETTQAAKCLRLSLVGFSNPEISQILQCSPATVASNLYAERKKSGKMDRKRPTKS